MENNNLNNNLPLDTEDIFESFNSNNDNDIFEDIFNEENSVTVKNNVIIDDRILNNPKYNSGVNQNKNVGEGLSISDNSNMILDDRIINDTKYDSFNFNDSMQEENDTNKNIIKKDKTKNNPIKNIFSLKRTSILLPVMAFIFVSILGMYLFVNNTKAETINLIKITENNKVGYINNDGTIIARAKYISGTDYYKGYAVVKNNNNLYGVLNDKGALQVPFGNYYYIGLFGNRYIVSKFTNNGLKQGLLDEKLDDLTKFKYDSISYLKDGIYLFTRDETMGVLNKDGKEIYTFKVDEIDDRNLSVEISNVDSSDKYAKVKVNESSTIINLSTGKEVYSYTLEDINVLDNNVFYIRSKNSNNSTYLVIKDDKIKLRTNKYKRIRIDDYSSDIALAITDEAKIEYINLNSGEIININENNNYYYNDGMILEITHDFNSDKDVYNIITSKGKISSFEKYKPVNNLFYNGILRVYNENEKNGFINSEGKLITNSFYEDASDFSSTGYSVVINDNTYGIINKKGKEVIPVKYTSTKLLEETFFNVLNNKYNLNLFIYADDNSKIGLLDSNNKIYIKAIYDKFEIINENYPIIIAYYNNEKVLLNLATGKELSIKLTNEDIIIKENYMIIGESYYNYNGKQIYTVK